MITLTAEQAQQIEWALNGISNHPQLGAVINTGPCKEALSTIREQKAELEKQRDGAVAQKCFGAGAAWPEQTVMKKAAYELSKWLSAALDDPKVCEEYKNAINGWYDAAMPFLPTKTGKLHRNVLLQALGGLLAGEYSLDAHSLDMYPSKNDDLQQIYEAIGAVKRELEGMAAPVQQAEQTPVAFIGQGLLPIVPEDLEKLRKYEPGTATLYDTPLYAAPVQQVDLTDDEIGSIYEKHHALGGCWTDGFAYERAIIAADREKNK